MPEHEMPAHLLQTYKVHTWLGILASVVIGENWEGWTEGCILD